MKKILFYLIFTFLIISSIFTNSLNDIIDNTIRFNKWSEAKVQLLKYLKNNPTDAKAYALYSQVLDQLNEYDEAIIAIRNAINYETSVEKKSYYYYNLGFYYYNKGLPDIALNSLEKSLEFNPQFDQAYYVMGIIYLEKNDTEKVINSWRKYVQYTTNIEKRKNVQDVLNNMEYQLAQEKAIEEEKKRKAEEERIKREELLNKLKDELSSEEKDTKALEADKDKTDTTDEGFLELEE